MSPIYFLRKLSSTKYLKERKRFFLLIVNFIKYGGLLVGLFIILDIFGVDTASVLAGAGLLGILLGFGLQKLMQDMINGFFIIFENQYVVGEFVSINSFVGKVIELGLKTTKIVTYNGEIHYFANGDIKSVINFSRNNSLVIIDLPILRKYHVEEINLLLKMVILKFRHHNIISEPKILGVQEVNDISYSIRITCETKSFEHFEITRLLKEEIVKVLNDNNIEGFDVK